MSSIVHIITGLNDGGAEAVLYRLCCADRQNRHSVISMMDAGKYGPLLEAAGISVYCLGMKRGRPTLSAIWRLWRLIRKLRPAVVQTWMYHADLIGGLTARLAGVTEVFWGIHHTSLDRGRSRLSTRTIAHLNGRLSYWIPLRISCCAERAREVHIRLGYPPERLVFIPNGYDFSLFSPNDETRRDRRSEWGIDERTVVFGLVARFDPLKDHDTLLTAFGSICSHIEDFRIVLAGDGINAKNDELLHLINKSGLHGKVLLLGIRTDVPVLMNAIDIHVLSSCSEAFPNVIAEAMACGTPCITTDVGDASTIVGDTGWVVPARNPTSLSAAIIDACKARADAKSWNDRRCAARQRIVSNYSLDRMIAAYHQLWFPLAPPPRI